MLKELETLAMERYLAGELTFTEQRRLRAWNAKEADDWFAGYLRHYEDAWRAYPDAAPSSEVGAAKPDPRIFHHACDGLGLEKEEVAYVGDRRETDAIAATDAGLRGIWLDRPRTSLRDIPVML